jgi:hypothetical protein
MMSNRQCSKKTVGVQIVKNAVNSMLKYSECSSDIRTGQILVLERILNDTGNYQGFKYLSESEVPTGKLPGIRLNVDQSSDLKFQETDSTRREYL